MVAYWRNGPDYYGMETASRRCSIADLEWQYARFRTHIRAARACAKLLVIHTRSASSRRYGAGHPARRGARTGAGNRAGGVFHCFTESAQVARVGALDVATLTLFFRDHYF